jgi:hypothetical protein
MGQRYDNYAKQEHKCGRKISTSLRSSVAIACVTAPGSLIIGVFRSAIFFFEESNLIRTFARGCKSRGRAAVNTVNPAHRSVKNDMQGVRHSAQDASGRDGYRLHLLKYKNYRFGSYYFLL